MRLKERRNDTDTCSVDGKRWVKGTNYAHVCHDVPLGVLKMTIDHDALALEVGAKMRGTISHGLSPIESDWDIEFARRYRKALAEKMEPVGAFQFNDYGGWQQLAEEYEDEEGATKLYSLGDWK